jgi:hypothetical protein
MPLQTGKRLSKEAGCAGSVLNFGTFLQVKQSYKFKGTTFECDNALSFVVPSLTLLQTNEDMVQNYNPQTMGG